MNFGERLSSVRKRKKLSQADVGKMININGDAYGRYERNEVKPTIEMATKIANALEISLDFLVGKTDLELDTSVMKRIEAVTKMSDEDKGHAFFLLDSFIAKVRMKDFA